MRIRTKYVEGGKWTVTPQEGLFEGVCVAVADGVSLSAVEIEGYAITGELQAVWGLDVQVPAIYDDPITTRGLRIGCAFNMLEQGAIDECAGGYALSGSKVPITGARIMKLVGKEMRVIDVTPETHNTERNVYA